MFRLNELVEIIEETNPKYKVGYIVEGPVRFDNEDENIYRVRTEALRTGVFRESRLRAYMTKLKPCPLMLKITSWPEKTISGAKRANVAQCDEIPDWFVGFGKDESCQFEGTWWDMICFARNVLASKNTELVAPEYYRPAWANANYVGEGKPYEFGKE